MKTNQSVSVYFSLGFCGSRAAIYGQGSPAKVAALIRASVPELAKHVAGSMHQIKATECTRSGASNSTCSFDVAKYDMSRYAMPGFETISL